MEKFEIKQESLKEYPRFRMLAKSISFKLKPIPEDEDPAQWIKSAISEVILRATAHLDPTDKVGITFSSADFSRGQGWMPFKEAEKITVDEVFELIGNIYQSNSAGLDPSTFELKVTSVKMPTGKGRVSTKSYNTFQEECHQRRGIITINNSDNLCLPIALVLAMEHINNYSNFRNLRKTKKLQKEKALQLCKEAKVVVPLEGCSLEEVKQFQDHLKDKFNITVYDFRNKSVLFEGPRLAEKKINLLFFENHFNIITSLTAAFCCVYYCEDCHVQYNQKDRHRCKKLCDRCKQANVCVREMKKQCPDCNRLFYNHTCFENHKKPGFYGENTTVCDELKFCLNCRKVIRFSKHTCGEHFCSVCKSKQPDGHYCFIAVDRKKPNLSDTLYIFFDLETKQETKNKNGGLLHEPNLCVFRTACDECINSTNNNCLKCGPNLVVLKGNDCIKDFIALILSKRKLFKNVIVLAHFGSGFDMQFILNHLITQTDHTPSFILNGTKIVLMNLANVKFLDSINFMPMALKDLPSALGLGDKFKKGYFPHLFNRTENENYVGPYPSVDYYEPDSMMEKERTKFLQWYEENKHLEFNFEKELTEYCVSDVEILAEACLKFRDLLLKSSDICPFSESCTIPGACNKIFRRHYLKENTIGIIPRNGYRLRDNQSKKALQWLVWEEKQRNINIIHAAKRKEVTLKGFSVDGFCEETNQIFEFHGCFYHACISCFKNNRDKPINKNNPMETFNTRYESTVYKTNTLRAMGYEVIEKWGCQFDAELRANKEMRTFTETHPLLNLLPLIARDAFYGGRTGNCKSYRKVNEGEKIKYVDVCSLYPFVCKYGKFPIGHPEVFVGEECMKLNLNETNGLIKCQILPPQDLYHPVLPKKMHNKLMFVLCNVCGEDVIMEECTHSAEERMITGTWVIDEVLKAVEKGYKIINILEIWRYEIVQYDAISKEGGLFVEMMNTFLKIKQESSDWPGDCKTEEDKLQYIEQFFAREGIQLEYNKIAKNPGLRSMAKLILNSFWGKFGQLERKAKIELIRTSTEFFELITNSQIIINSIVPVDENIILANYVETEDSFKLLSTVNVAIAAYVTAQARLKLYSYLEELNDRVLYYDTDSVIFTHREGEYEPPTGDFIGDMTDELEGYGRGSFITEFASGGPKNYSYKVFSTRENKEKGICKVKGIKLNYKAKQIVNFETMKEMIVKEKKPVSIISKNFRRTATHEVVTMEEKKIYRINCTKRRFLDNYDSVPFGYKKFKNN